MKNILALVLLVSMSVACSDSEDPPPGTTKQSLTANELCTSIESRAGERVRVSGHVFRGYNACTAIRCEDGDGGWDSDGGLGGDGGPVGGGGSDRIGCNYCAANYLLSCDGSNEDEEDAIDLYAADDLELPFVGLDPSSGEYLHGDIPLKTRLGCVGSEVELVCQPENPRDIATLEATVTEHGTLRVHAVELRSE